MSSIPTPKIENWTCKNTEKLQILIGIKEAKEKAWVKLTENIFNKIIGEHFLS